MKEISENISKSIDEVFDEEHLNNLARENNFIQRSTNKLEGVDFVKLMTLGFIENSEISLEGLCDILQDINPDASMTPQALSQRINSDNAVNYLEDVLKIALQKNLEGVQDINCAELLSPFGRVLLEDSTQCSLNEKLADEFKGSGGSASKSSVKIDLTFDIKNHTIPNIIITDGNVPDQSLGGALLNDVQKDDLFIRDLGYFVIDYFEKINGAEAFYLSRLHKGVNVFLSDSKDTSPIDLPAYIQEHFPCQEVIDLDVYIAKERMPTRLIVYKMPEEVINLRRRKAHQSAKKKGRVLSQDYLNWLGFGFYIVNVPSEIWPAEIIGTVYRLRWEIELIFKSWKSLLNIHILKGTRPERIKCLIYGRLIAITVMTKIYGCAFIYAKNQFKREISLYKLFDWLKRSGRLLKAVHTQSLNFLINDLMQNILKVCKQKRTRKTILQMVEDQIKYMDSFLKNSINRQQQKKLTIEIEFGKNSKLSSCFYLLDIVFAEINSFFMPLGDKENCLA